MNRWILKNIEILYYIHIFYNKHINLIFLFRFRFQPVSVFLMVGWGWNGVKSFYVFFFLGDLMQIKRNDRISTKKVVM